jgi:hypothetical protein
MSATGLSPRLASSDTAHWKSVFRNRGTRFDRRAGMVAHRLRHRGHRGARVKGKINQLLNLIRPQPKLTPEMYEPAARPATAAERAAPLSGPRARANQASASTQPGARAGVPGYLARRTGVASLIALLDHSSSKGRKADDDPVRRAPADPAAEIPGSTAGDARDPVEWNRMTSALNSLAGNPYDPRVREHPYVVAQRPRSSPAPRNESTGHKERAAGPANVNAAAGETRAPPTRAGLARPASDRPVLKDGPARRPIVVGGSRHVAGISAEVEGTGHLAPPPSPVSNIAILGEGNVPRGLFYEPPPPSEAVAPKTRPAGSLDDVGR